MAPTTTTTAGADPTTTIATVVGAVPPELTGNWRAEHPDGSAVRLNLNGTNWSMEILGAPGTAVGGNVTVEGNSMVLATTFQCSVERAYTWAVEGGELLLTLVGEDPCPSKGYLDGLVYTRG